MNKSRKSENLPASVLKDNNVEAPVKFSGEPTETITRESCMKKIKKSKDDDK
ncbi:hypothetical protein GCM10010465_20890 [Actinomadura fibrosa]